MKLQEIVDFLEAKPLCLHNPGLLNREYYYVSVTDLMSDALAMIVTPPGQTILITGLANGQSLRTAEMMDIMAVIYVRNKALSEENIDLAESMELNTFTTALPMFDAVGILYREGLKTATRQPNDS